MDEILATQFLTLLRAVPPANAPQECAIVGTAVRRLRVLGDVSLRGQTFPFPIRIEYVDFAWPVDFTECRIDGALRMESCNFFAGLWLRDLHVKGLFSLRFSRLSNPKTKWLDFRRLHIEGVTDFSCVTAAVGIDLTNAMLNDDVRLDGLRGRTAIRDESDIPHDASREDREHLRNELIGKAINCEGVEIRRHLYVYAFGDRRFHIRGMFDLRAKIGAQVMFLNARINAGQGGTAVDMVAAKVAGSVFFRNKTVVTGKIDLRANVGGQVTFENVTVNAGQDGTAVDMESATVSGLVFFRNKTVVTGKIDLRANVGGQVVFDNTTINAGTNETAVDMTDAIIRGAVFFRNGTVIVGELKLHQTTLHAGLWAAESSTQPPTEQPKAAETLRNLLVVGRVDVSYAIVHGPMLFHGASIFGDIEANHLHVHGDLDWCGSIIGPKRPTDDEFEQLTDVKDARLRWTDIELRRPNPQDTGKNPGFEMKMATVEGRLWFKGTRFLGDVNLEDTRITGEVNFAHGCVAGNLGMRSAKVEGSVVVRCQSEPNTDVAGVKGYVDCSYAKFGELDCAFTTPQGDIVPTYINLTGAEVGVLQLRGVISECERGPESRGLIVAEGLKFQHVKLDDNLLPPVHVGPTLRDACRHLFWLAGVAGAAYFAINHDCAVLGIAVVLYVAMCLASRCSVLLALVAALGFGSACALYYDQPWLAFLLFVPGLVALLGVILEHTNLWFGPPSQCTTKESLRGGFTSCLTLGRSAYHRCFQVPRRSAAVLNLLAWSYPFSRPFYIVVENWLRNAGDDLRADEAFLMRRRRETGTPNKAPQKLAEATKDDPALKEDWKIPSMGMALLNGLFDFALGFGVRWGRLVHIYLLLFLVNTGIFLSLQSVERPISYVQPRTDLLSKNKRDIVQEAEKNPPQENPWPANGFTPTHDEWGIANAAFMALRVQVPVLTLGAENDWEPASRPMLGTVTYEEYASLMVVVNFILIPLFIAGVTRQMRKQ